MFLREEEEDRRFFIDRKKGKTLKHKHKIVSSVRFPRAFKINIALLFRQRFLLVFKLFIIRLIP